jgi:hypothetical protein
MEIDASRRMEAALTGVRNALPSLLVSRFNHDLGAMNDFGLERKKPRKQTVKQKAAAVAKGAATRKERHTMGKRQRAKIRGAT